MNIGESKAIIVDPITKLTLHGFILSKLSTALEELAVHVAKQRSENSNKLSRQLSVLRHAIERASEDQCLDGESGIIAKWHKQNPEEITAWLQPNYQYPIFSWNSPPPAFLLEIVRKVLQLIDTAIQVQKPRILVPVAAAEFSSSVTAIQQAALRPYLEYTPPVYAARKKDTVTTPV